MNAVPAQGWDACANPRAGPPGEGGPDAPDSFNPFVSHAFLSALEEAGCVGRGTGWSPAHVLVENPDGRLAAAAPAYLKSHSQGEYVFDYGWADAYERAGGRYYPKLQVSVPFTPVTGPRLLTRPDAPGGARQALIDGLRTLRAQTKASSIHLTFVPDDQAQVLAGAGLLLRNDRQFHWFNEAYGSFDDFLGALASRKRKAIRRERREERVEAVIGGVFPMELLVGAFEEAARAQKLPFQLGREGDVNRRRAAAPAEIGERVGEVGTHGLGVQARARE